MVQLFNLLSPLPPTPVPIPQLFLHRKVEAREKSYGFAKAAAIQAGIFLVEIAVGSTPSRLVFDLRKINRVSRRLLAPLSGLRAVLRKKIKTHNNNNNERALNTGSHHFRGER